MTSSFSSAVNLKAEIAKALELQKQIEVLIAKGHEVETDRLSREYEAVIKRIFALHKGESEHILTKVEFSKELLLAEHPMPTLVEAVFASLKEDLNLVFLDEAADTAKPAD